MPQAAFLIESLWQHLSHLSPTAQLYTLLVYIAPIHDQTIDWERLPQLDPEQRKALEAELIADLWPRVLSDLLDEYPHFPEEWRKQ